MTQNDSLYKRLLKLSNPILFINSLKFPQYLTPFTFLYL